MTRMDESARVGENISAANASWSFGGDIAKTFSEHVRRSVPFYDEGHQLICHLSDFFIKFDSICYEIGTSTGELLQKLAEHNAHKSDARWVGLDVEEEMVAEAERRLAGRENVNIELADALLYDFEKSDLIVSYYCIQFVQPKHRQELITKIYDSLNWGGAFIWFEKVRAPDARFQDIYTSLYNEYKIEQGYSADEIVAKSRSLKGILEPFSTQGNIGLLERAGFVDLTTVQKYVCFEGYLAIK